MKAIELAESTAPGWVSFSLVWFGVRIHPYWSNEPNRGMAEDRGEGAQKSLQGALLKSIVPWKKSKLTDFADLLSSLLLRIKGSVGDSGSVDVKRYLKKTKHTLEKIDSAAGLDEQVTTAFKILLLYLTILTSLGISEDPSALQLVVDVTLSMLSMQSLHVRAVATAAFSLLYSHISDEALALVLEVGEDDEMESEEESDEDSDAELDEQGDADEELKARLRAALGTAAADEEDSEAEEVVPTDEQMFELDGAIAEAFRSRLRPDSKEKSREQTVNIHFQSRCLNLLNGYAKSDLAPLHHLIRIADTLVKASSSVALRSSHEALNVISDTLHIISGVRKFGTVLDVRSDIESLASAVMEQVTLVSHVAMKNSLSALCAFLIRCHKKVCSELKIKKCEQHWYMPLYMKTLNSYLDENSHVSPQLFVKLMEAFPEHCTDFVEHLAPRATDSVERNYKRLHILGLLVAALRILQVDASSEARLAPAMTALSELSITLLAEMAQKKELKVHLAVELCDLLLLIAKHSTNVGLEWLFVVRHSQEYKKVKTVVSLVLTCQG
ncbi:hypothetical protein HPB48_025542 [Haemaphysalis longicornis]|uniref:Uncharacterized protein n=1 Tax=Haemaphysalis longicornis TaxID=44386 RepID=A0A9J6H925_HAELO|nr:hypothetical protein HPB48_025542 [Haemaphysalis longicornis]